MAAAPSRLEGHAMDLPVDEGSDVDAEGEEDMDMMEQATPAATTGAVTTDAEGSDVDAEGEEIDDEDAGEPVGAVKIAGLDGNEDEEDEDAAIESSSEDPRTSEADPGQDSSSESESDAANEWEGQSDTAEEVETGIVDPNRCVFCGEDEEHDPGEDFEEYLACAVCGDNAHRQCARDANSLKPGTDAEHWRCATCVEHGLQADSKHESTPTARRRSSAPKLARDLLPAHRGANKPDSHSVFNTLIHPDDPMDGTRALRKRKHESNEPETSTRASTRKRRRPSQTSSASEPGDAAEPQPSSPDTVRHTSHADAVDEDGQDSDDEGSQAIRSSRRTRQKRSNSQKVDQPGALILKSTNKQLLVAFTNLDQKKLTDVLSSTAKQKRRRERDRIRRAKQRNAAAAPEPEVSHYPAISLSTNFASHFPSWHERDADDIKNKPYGGILTETEADMSKTFPQAVDRKRFEDARQRAEEDWKKRTAANNTAPEPSRNKMSGPPSKIKCISFGGYEIDTWHAAPYPEEYSRNKVLYICEFCLKYMNSDYVAWRHKLKCPAKHPPGDEIYRDGRFSFFEVDGRKNPVYCQNLCLLAKLFLGSKTLYYDVEPFLFYVMTETDEFGCHFVGYFSKEKRPSSLNNVSCILVLPIHQRKGFGHMLIDFSYLLTRVEKKSGSPEKPLSDMGLVSYRSYWRLILCYQFLHQKEPISITKISERTGMTADDIVSALEGLRALVRDPVTKRYALRLDYEFFKQYIDKFESKNYPQINPDALVWTPYVMGRNNLAHYDEAPAISTVAPREGEDEVPVAPEEGVQAQIAQEAAEAKMNGEHKLEETVDSAVAPSVTEETAEPSTTDRHSPARRPKTPTEPATSTDDLNTVAAPATPKTNGVSHRNSTTTPSAKNNSAIPPTRFEVFPPIPGTGRKRGRPLSSSARRTSNTGTPFRRGGKATGPETPLAGQGKQITMGTRESLRRTRSKLAEVVINGEDATMVAKDEVLEEEEEEIILVDEKFENAEGENVEVDGEEPAEALQDDVEEEVDLIKVGAPVKGKGKGKSRDGKGRSPLKGNGKGKAKVVVEEQDADDDIDAIGEEDPDV